MIAAWIGVAWGGDVWMTVQARDREGSVAIDLPAAVLDADVRPVTTTTGATVDLAALVREVAALPEGTSRPVEPAGGTVHLVFVHRAAVPTPSVSRLRVVVVGERARGVEVVLPLDGSALGSATTNKGLRVDGLSLDFAKDGVGDAIGRAAPRTLIDAALPDGSRLKVASQ